MADAEGQADWADQFVKEVLLGLPGQEWDPFGGQQMTREMLGESERAGWVMCVGGGGQWIGEKVGIAVDMGTR